MLYQPNDTIWRQKGKRADGMTYFPTSFSLHTIIAPRSSVLSITIKLLKSNVINNNL